MNLYVPFNRAGHGVPFARVRGYCRGGHALVYGAILLDLGTIYEVAGSNSGLSDSPVFRNLLGLVGTYRGRGSNGNKRPGLK